MSSRHLSGPKTKIIIKIELNSEHFLNIVCVCHEFLLQEIVSNVSSSGFTFTFRVTIIVSVFVPGRSRAVQSAINQINIFLMMRTTPHLRSLSDFHGPTSAFAVIVGQTTRIYKINILSHTLSMCEL